MAATYEAIATVTVGSGGAGTVTFSSIPQTYTDLLIKVSARGDANFPNQSYEIRLNGSTSNASGRRIYGNGASAASDTTAYIEGVGATATASTFSNDEIYIPNYTSSNNKSVSIDNVSENNATTAYAVLEAFLWSNSAAVTSIDLVALNAGSQEFVQYSTFTLYGIKNS